MARTIGFIGFGEAAFGFASGLREAGLADRMVAYDACAGDAVHGPRIHERAVAAQVELMDSMAAAVTCADVIFSANSAGVAVSVAKEAAPFVRPDAIYADINATSSMTKEEVGRLIPAGCSVDVAVMGPVPITRQATPLLLSGAKAKAFLEIFQPYGMKAEVVGGEPGMASAIKMIRSIYMKGIAALLYECLEAAQRAGVTAHVVDSITETMTEVPFPALVKRLVCGTAVHAKRRSKEMAEVLATLSSLESPAHMSEATHETLMQLIARGVPDAFASTPPKDVQQVMAYLVTGTSSK